MIDIQKFLAGYIGAALWSTTDSRDPDGNDMYNLDAEFDSVSEPCRAAMLEDCNDFVTANLIALEEFKEAAGVNCDDWRLGFLFWLNRHGHGSGYWDELPSGSDAAHRAEELSEAAKVYSSFELFGDFEAGFVRSHHYG